LIPFEVEILYQWEARSPQLRDGTNLVPNKARLYIKKPWLLRSVAIYIDGTIMTTKNLIKILSHMTSLNQEYPGPCLPCALLSMHHTNLANCE